MDVIRYERDDYIPRLRDAGVASEFVKTLIAGNASSETLIEVIQIERGIVLKIEQIRQLLSDLAHVGVLEGVATENLPNPVIRPAAPSGLGCSQAAIWITPPATPYEIRFYVNGVHRHTLHDYNSTDPATLGSVAGDIIQAAMVATSDIMDGENIQTPKGTVGWMSRIKAV